MTTSPGTPDSDQAGTGGVGSTPGRSWLADAAILAGTVYFLIPLVWLLISSTKSYPDLNSTFGFFFGRAFNLFQNIGDVFAQDDGAFVGWMVNTAIYAVAAAIGSAVISTLAGYAFAVYRFRGRRALIALVMASVFVPATILAVPLYLLIGTTGLSNTLWAVILPAFVNPFGVFLMFIYAQRAIPIELIDAGRVDGAGEFRIFGQINFRLLAPAFVTVTLFAFVAAWNNYFLPLLVLRESSVFTVSLGLANWNNLATLPGQGVILYELIITGSVLAILPVMLVFLYLSRYWQTGLSFGSVKG